MNRKSTKRICIVLLVVLLGAQTGCSTRPIEANEVETVKPKETNGVNEQSLLKMDTCFHADLVYHIFSYMDLSGNYETMYSKEYIDRFEEFRKEQGNTYDLLKEADKLKDGYKKNRSAGMFILSKLYMYKDYDDMVFSLKNNLNFNKKINEEFVLPFIKCMDQEKEIYKKYCEQEKKNREDYIKEFQKKTSEKYVLFKKLSDYSKKTAKCYLSISLNHTGRGYFGEKELAAAIYVPKNSEEVDGAFYQALHEMSYMIVSRMFTTNSSNIEDSYKELVKITVRMNYMLIYELDRSLVSDYTKWANATQMQSDNELSREQESRIRGMVEKIIQS